MEMDMNFRLREMMILRLEDTVGDMKYRATTDQMGLIVRSLCECSMWLIKDWPNQKIDNLEKIRSCRMDSLGRLRQLLRSRPPRHSEMDTLILLLADAILTITEQWPGGQHDIPSSSSSNHQTIQHQLSLPITTPSTTTSIHIPPVYAGQVGQLCKPPPCKLPRNKNATWTVDGYQQQSSNVPPSMNTQPSLLMKNPIYNPSSLNIPPSSSPKLTNSQVQDRRTSFPQPTSVLWQYFTRCEIQGALKSKCNICSKYVSRANHGTSSMKSHLKVHHPTQFSTLNQYFDTTPDPPHVSPPSTSEHKIEQSDTTPDSSQGGNTSLRTELCKEYNTDFSLFNNGGAVKEEQEDNMEFAVDDSQYNRSMECANESNDDDEDDEISSIPLQRRFEVWIYYKKIDKDEGDPIANCTLCSTQIILINNCNTMLWKHLIKYHIDEYNRLNRNNDKI